MTEIAEPAVRREPLFVETGSGRVYAIRFSCRDVPPRRPVVIMAPFGEEMNRARRMMTLQAEALARQGHCTWVFDYSGTGDSDGEFADATLESWLADSRAMLARIAVEQADPPAVIAVRLAAPIAVRLLQDTTIAQLLLWQPVVSGSTWLTQFLRIRLAADLEAGAGRETTNDLRRRIAAGETLEIAGYGLGTEMARSIDDLRLADMVPPSSMAVDWFELRTELAEESAAEAALTPAGRPVVAAWREAGVAVSTHAVVGEPFWLIQEITLAPALIKETCRAVAGADA